MSIKIIDEFTKDNTFGHKKFKKNLYAINISDIEKKISIPLINTRELGYSNIINGIILPLRKTDISSVEAIYEGGVCDESFNFISGHRRNDNNKYNNYEAIRSYRPSNIDYSNDTVVYAGIAFSHFGHFLLETMNRLWWITKNKKFNIKVVFLKNRPFDAPFIELLELVGLKKENILFLETATKFKKVIVPEQSLWFANFYHKEFLLPYDSILEKIIPSEYKKIYLSRTQLAKKDFINEEYFEDFYKDMGYKIVYPEQLDIKEQIALMSGADEIVSTIGTISHLALFAKKGTKIISLLRFRRAFNVVQLMINQARELDYTYVDVTCNFLPTKYSANCFYIGPNINWQDFVKQEYGLELGIDLFDYLNSNNSHMGDYFKLWLKVFSTKSELNKIKKDNSLDILKNLEVVFANEAIDFKTSSEKLVKDLVEKPSLPSRFAEKTFLFSRYDGTHAREIYLNTSGLIQTVSGKGNTNESFWTVKNNKLNFLNRNGELTSQYFCVKEKENGLFLLGYYEINKEIMFKLEEVKVIP